MELFQTFENLKKYYENGDKKPYSMENDELSFEAHLDSYIAQRITNAMYSNSPEIKVLNNQKQIDKKATEKLTRLLKKQNFFRQLKAMSDEVSLTGLGGFMIQNFDDVSIIPLSSRHMFLPTYDQYGNLVEIQLTRKLFAGAKPYFTHQRIDKKEIETMFSATAKATPLLFSEFNKAEQLFSNKTFPAIQKHNLEKVPIVLFTNKVYVPNLISLQPDLFFLSLATTYNAKELRPRLNRIWKMLGIELHRGRTMLIGKDNAPDIEGQAIENKVDSFANDNMLNIIDGEEIEYVGGAFSGIEQLRKEFKETLNEYYRRCFISTTTNIASRNQKNDLEIYQGSREEVQYIENRVSLHQNQLEETLMLFKKAYLLKNPNDKVFNDAQEIVVNIITNEVRDSVIMAQTFADLFEKGILPQDYVVKKILAISENDASALAKKAKQEHKEKARQEANLKKPQTPLPSGGK